MQVNIWAILVSAVASMIVGSIWYGPLFGKLFISTMGWDKLPQEQKDAMKKGMALTYVGQFLSSVLSFYVLAMFIVWLEKYNVQGGMQIAFWAWLGFAFPIKVGDALWGGKKTLFWLGVGNTLITFLVGGAIIGFWR